MAGNQRRSLAFPIALIAVGALFLYANYRPGFDPWPVLRTYWPLILIFIGLGKMWDASQQRQNPDAPRGSSVGLTVGMLLFVLVLVMLMWHGRAFSRDHHYAGSVHHESRTVERQGAQSVRASLDAGAGQLNIGGGSSHLLDADFNYSESYGNPRVDYNVSNGVGDLSVSQDGDHTHFVGVSHNEWNLRFGNDVPLELKINMGAGQGQLRLRDVPVTRLDVEMGAGQFDVDLTGDRKKDLDADIQGGVGQATIRLPKNVGVVAHASGGIGAVNAHGLKHDGDEYTNDAYGKTPATIHLNVQGGVGEVSLVQEP
jgi:hypothetical protein